MTTSLRQKELVRGKVLYYLHLIYPQQSTMQLLQAELDYFGYPVPIEELSFHVAYLQDKKLVEVETVRGPYSHRSVNLVKITARGIDFLDGRLPADDGIYLEPTSG